MKTLILYIERNQPKEFFDHLNILLKDPSFDINRTFNKKDSKYSEIWIHTLFSYSCLYGNLEICKHLASKNADPIGKKSKIGEGFPLSISILHNQFHISDWLQKKFNIDCSINNSWPLRESASSGNLSGVKYALKHNADIHADGGYALQLAARNGYLGIVKYLISKGVDLHADNDSALRYAASNGHLSIVKYLISKSADIHAEEDFALRWAAYNGHLSIVKYLISKGANIHAENDFALRWAVWHNHSETTKYLLDHGANPNAKDDNGCILQWLIDKNQLYLAAKAVFYGADPTILSPSQQQKLNNYILSKKMTKAKKL